MAKKNSVSLKAKYECIKEVDCEWCHTRFQFPMVESTKGSGPTLDDAVRDAREKSRKSLEREPGHEACPTCGALQVSMGASKNAFAHGCALWFAGILLAIGLLIAFLINQNIVSLVTASTVSWTLFFVSILTLLFNIRIVRQDPNADLIQSRAAAAAKVKEQKIVVISTTHDALPDSIPTSVSVFQWAAIGLCALGITLYPAAELLRITSGWASNPNCVPPVAGPGDEVTVFWPKSLPCLKGHWKGAAFVNLVSDDPFATPMPLEATGRVDGWGGVIGGKGAHNQDTAIWTKVKLPDDPALVGKKIKLDAKMSINYPHSTGLLSFEEAQVEFENVFTLKLAVPRAATRYNTAWWIGLIGGSGLVVLSSFLLRRHQLGLCRSSVQPKTLNFQLVTDKNSAES